jgi:hypothetical protein
MMPFLSTDPTQMKHQQRLKEDFLYGFIQILYFCFTHDDFCSYGTDINPRAPTTPAR